MGLQAGPTAGSASFGHRSRLCAGDDRGLYMRCTVALPADAAL